MTPTSVSNTFSTACWYQTSSLIPAPSQPIPSTTSQPTRPATPLHRHAPSSSNPPPPPNLHPRPNHSANAQLPGDFFINKKARAVGAGGHCAARARPKGTYRPSPNNWVSRMRGSMAGMTRKGAYDASMRTPSLAYGDNFICRHCEALYLVSYTELPIADSGTVYCDVCRRQMIQWNSSQEPSYKLVKRPDPN